MTFTLAEVLLLVIAVTLLAMVSQLMRLVHQAAEAAKELEKLSEAIAEVRQLTRNAEMALFEARKTAGRIDRIAETIEQATTLVGQLLTPLSRRLGALMSGVKTAFVALRRGGSPHDNGMADDNGATVARED